MSAKDNALKSRLYLKEAVKIEDIAFCLFCHLIPRSYPVSDTKELLILFTGALRKEKGRRKINVFLFLEDMIIYSENKIDKLLERKIKDCWIQCHISRITN